MGESSRSRIEAAGGTNGALEFRVVGVLDFDDVPDLLRQSVELFGTAAEVVVDLSGVTRANSAGLALLLEWRRLARGPGRRIAFRNAPDSLRNLARVSELEAVLSF